MMVSLGKTVSASLARFSAASVDSNTVDDTCLASLMADIVS